MVQKEVIKKTRSYGLIGVLLAVLLVAMIYSYGVTPGISPIASPNASPSTENGSPMRTFASYDDLKNFLSASGTNNAGSQWNYEPRGTDGTFTLNPSLPAPAPTSAPTSEIAADAKGFSSTNIQVAGVDEADTVKTDGNNLFMIGNNSQTVYILNANPQNAKVLSKIPFTNAYLSGIYLSSDGSKLAVIGNQWVPYFIDEKLSVGGYSLGLAAPYWNTGTTFVYVYDVSNAASPTLARNFTMSGSYVNSRMIGNYLYNIVTESAYVLNNATVTLPAFFSGAAVSNVAPTKIYFADTADSYYSYTTIVSLNVMDDVASSTNMTLMMGGAGTIYVSTSNIYVTYPDARYETLPQTSPAPTDFPVRTPDGKDSSSKGISIMPITRIAWQGTFIYRISVSGPTLTFAAKGNVTGNVLNQYAMDESGGYFRIVTTYFEYNSTNAWTGTQQNGVYALDMNLNVVGKLEKLGTGENFHSARFIGNRLYMVTFQKTDPLFVVDLSQPANLKLVGELVMPGYSDYLHPYDETHLIGLGKDAIADEGTDFAWYQGLKLSLFDVADVNAPKEIAKLIIGDRGTSSEALYDPKAFLFDKSKNLLVIPVELYLVNKSSSTADNKLNVATPSAKTNGSVSILPMPIAPPFIGSGSASSQYGTFVWQGAYVLSVNPEGGFIVKGNVTQFDNAAALWSDPSLPMRSSYQWMDYNHYISRSLYIGNVLYTFSQNRVQLNSLDNFAVLARIDLD